MADAESLYVLDAKLRDLIRRHTDPDTGELDEQFEADIEALGYARERKLLAYGHVWKSLMAQAEQIKGAAKPFADEAYHLRQRAKYKENAAERLRARAEAFMDASEKLEDDTVRLGFRQSTRVLVADGAPVEDWPAQYRKSEPRRKELGQAAKDGAELPEGVTIDTRKRLTIK